MYHAIRRMHAQLNLAESQGQIDEAVRAAIREHCNFALQLSSGDSAPPNQTRPHVDMTRTVMEILLRLVPEEFRGFLNERRSAPPGPPGR